MPSALHPVRVSERASTTAASYLPRRVAEAYASADPPAPPCVSPFHSVLLFADVTGYSSLTRGLERSDDGCWAASQLLNALFGAIAEQIKSCGGDVLKFAGDAVLAAFELPADTAEHPRVAAAALYCAEALLHLDKVYPAQDAQEPLTLHVALHCGLLAEMHLGSRAGSLAHLVTGAPCVELGPLIGAAGPEEVVCSHAFWELLPRGCDAAARAEALPVGWRLRKPPTLGVFEARAVSSLAPPSADVLASCERYLPPYLVTTLRAGSSAWLAENRRVSCVFFALPTYGAGDFEMAQAVELELASTVCRLGGSMVQTITDDKGTVSIAVWGRPPRSDCTDAVRALAAAGRCVVAVRAISQRFGRGSDRVAAGVTSGRSFCGAVGSAARCEWAVVGDVMNTAARLSSLGASPAGPHAGCALVCDSATARAAASAAEDDGSPPPAWAHPSRAVPAQLKGRAAPTGVYHPPLPDEGGRAAGGSPDSLLSGGDSRSLATLRVAVSPHHRCSSVGGGSPQSGGGEAASCAPTGGREHRSLDLPRGRPSGGVGACSADTAEAQEGFACASFGCHQPAAPAAAEESAVSAPPPPAAAFYGRKAELDNIVAALNDKEGQRGLLLLVTAGLSMGKSTFVRAVCRAGADAGLAVLVLASPDWASGFSPESSSVEDAPFAAWRTAWMASLCTADAMACLPLHLRVVAPSLLADLLPPGCDAHAALLLEASRAAGDAGSGKKQPPPRVAAPCGERSCPHHASPLASPASPPQPPCSYLDAERARAAIVEHLLIHALAVQPPAASDNNEDPSPHPPPPPPLLRGLLLAADDAPCLDALSLRLLTAISASPRLRPAVLLTAGWGELGADPSAEAGGDDARATSLTPAVAQLTSSCTRCIHVRLGALDCAACAELGAGVLGVPPASLPDGLPEALLRLAGDHPLFIKELVALLKRRGHIRVDATTGGVSLSAPLESLPDVVALCGGGTDGRERGQPGGGGFGGGVARKSMSTPRGEARARRRSSSVPDGGDGGARAHRRSRHGRSSSTHEPRGGSACGSAHDGDGDDVQGLARLELLVQRRVDSLSARARGCLKAAAVLPPFFDVSLLAATAVYTHDAAAAAAAELAEEGFLQGHSWHVLRAGGASPAQPSPQHAFAPAASPARASPRAAAPFSPLPWRAVGGAAAAEGCIAGGAGASSSLNTTPRGGEGVRASCASAASSASASTASSCRHGAGPADPPPNVFSFAHRAVRALVAAATPPDQRALLHGRAYDAASAATAAEPPAGADPSGVCAWLSEQPQAPLRLFELARLARGAGRHALATSLFLASAKGTATAQVADVQRAAREGLASLDAAEGGGRARPSLVFALRPSCVVAPRLPPNAYSASLCSDRSDDSSASVRRLRITSSSHAAAAPAPGAVAAGIASPLLALRAELESMLDMVESVQASWALIQPHLNEIGVGLNAFAHFKFAGVSGPDDPAAEPKMRTHALVLLRSLGSVVSGLRDFTSLVPTIRALGRAHARFSFSIRVYIPSMGHALQDVLRSFLGEECSDEVASAWAATFDVVAHHMLDGLAEGEAEVAAAADARVAGARVELGKVASQAEEAKRSAERAGGGGGGGESPTARLTSLQQVHGSWDAIKLSLDRVGLELMRAFFAKRPDAFSHFTFGGATGPDDPFAAPGMQAHAQFLLNTLGKVVVSANDGGGGHVTHETASMLRALGRAHARFTFSIREYLPAMGCALQDSLRSALGFIAYNPTVAAAWQATYELVVDILLEGLCTGEEEALSEGRVAARETALRLATLSTALVADVPSPTWHRT